MIMMVFCLFLLRWMRWTMRAKNEQNVSIAWLLEPVAVDYILFIFATVAVPIRLVYIYIFMRSPLRTYYLLSKCTTLTRLHLSAELMEWTIMWDTDEQLVRQFMFVFLDYVLWNDYYWLYCNPYLLAKCINEIKWQCPDLHLLNSWPGLMNSK